MIKRPNKPVKIIGKAQELLYFLDAYGIRPVIYLIHFLLIHLQFARAYKISGVFYLTLAKFTFFSFSKQLFFLKLL